MGTNTALPIFAYYTKFINADDSLNISQDDFEAPETILKSPIDCNYNKTEIQNNNSDNIWEEEDNQW